MTSWFKCSLISKLNRKNAGMIMVHKNNKLIGLCIAEHLSVVEKVRSLSEELNRSVEAGVECLRAGGKLLFCGNGGSAADAQHLAAEFTGRFLKERSPWAAMALHANTSAVTAVGNDYGFDQIFSREVRAHGRQGDMLIAISTSGNSPNILHAILAAREKQMVVMGLTGQNGGKMISLCDICLCVPSHSTPRIQEAHILLGHIFCQLIEETLCSNRQ